MLRGSGPLTESPTVGQRTVAIAGLRAILLPFPVTDSPDYAYKWLPGSLVDEPLIEELAELYSSHYGVWGLNGRHPFRPIKLSARNIARWLLPNESRLAYAELDGRVVGYAIAVQPRVGRLGVVSWVSQLVVHADHRRRDVGKRLLFSIWDFSDHYAWGLVTANPYAVRALEKATRRRCDPKRIAQDCKPLVAMASTQVPYVSESTERVVDSTSSRVNTQFFVDHTELPYMLEDVTKIETPWTLSNIPEGWEWLAFTFKDQPEIELTEAEIETMVRTSDVVAKQAYSRMRLNASHAWAQHTPAEVELIIRECELAPGSSVLDVGCGTGRHIKALAKHDILGTGVDYLPEAIETRNAEVRDDSRAQFVLGDARDLHLEMKFDAVLCLYDVIGSYVDSEDNIRIIRSIRRHLRPGGKALISVMNFDLTYRKARHFFNLKKEPNRLLQLPPSTIMEKTGNVFNPDYYMIDEATEIVYRKEQFAEGSDLPAQLLVRDR
ncbi:MAG TPA: bifunctional N-acetyltransferase/class I SAM-dependent methyltransferase, partial [Bryobacteraceae bacterium]|nr:bifunctional N-acetyltransferase/class I SAM-dependent methyltransferase [Bryobacteraceae bacterium]